jgi:hypothetical protein
MRTERNPLYKGPAPQWPRGALVAWIACMAAVEVCVLISDEYLEAALFGAAALVFGALGLRRDWNR